MADDKPLDRLREVFLSDQADAVALTDEFAAIIDVINRAAADIGMPPAFHLTEDRRSARMDPDLMEVVRIDPRFLLDLLAADA